MSIANITKKEYYNITQKHVSIKNILDIIFWWEPNNEIVFVNKKEKHYIDKTNTITIDYGECITDEIIKKRQSVYKDKLIIEKDKLIIEKDKIISDLQNTLKIIEKDNLEKNSENIYRYSTITLNKRQKILLDIINIEKFYVFKKEQKKAQESNKKESNKKESNNQVCEFEIL